jgi:hypothetical protein
MNLTNLPRKLATMLLILSLLVITGLALNVDNAYSG